MLEKKEKVLLKKAAAEVEKAKEFTRAKNKRGMIAKCMHFLLKISFSWCYVFDYFVCLSAWNFTYLTSMHIHALHDVWFFFGFCYTFCAFSHVMHPFWFSGTVCTLLVQGNSWKKRFMIFFPPFSKTIKPHNWNILIMTPEEKSTLFFCSQQTCKHWHTQCRLTCLFHCFVLNIQ